MIKFIYIYIYIYIYRHIGYIRYIVYRATSNVTKYELQKSNMSIIRMNTEIEGVLVISYKNHELQKGTNVRKRIK